jgi:hypothetical protein
MDLRYSSIRVNTVLLMNRAVSQDIAVRLGVTSVAVEVTAQDPADAYKAVYRITVTRAYPAVDVELARLAVTSVSAAVTPAVYSAAGPASRPLVGST